MKQGKLFENSFDSDKNLLPKDGIANYYGQIFNHKEAEFYKSILLDKIKWKHDELFMFGKKITTKRKVAWYGDEGLNYTYSNATKKAQPWTKELLTIKALVEEKTKEKFNSCLLNLYHNGSEGMGWHSDDEKELKKNGAIASISLGAARKFNFRHKKSKEKLSVNLENGSLLVMKEKTQTHWQHQLPPSKKIMESRINLTFRKIAD